MIGKDDKPRLTEWICVKNVWRPSSLPSRNGRKSGFIEKTQTNNDGRYQMKFLLKDCSILWNLPFALNSPYKILLRKFSRPWGFRRRKKVRKLQLYSLVYKHV